MKKPLLALPFLLLAFTSQAQLFIDNNYSIQEMIEGFFGNSNVTISNVSYTGTQPSLAFFEGSQSNIGMNAGLLITSGDATLAIGPNDTESAGANFNNGGTSWLNALIPGYTTYDASIIEMDIVPSTDTLCFKYVFSSEEYQEYVGTSYNDLFAFLIDGPGLPQGDTVWVQADTLLTYDSCFLCVDTFLVFNQVYCDSFFDPQTGIFIDSCWTYSDTLTTWCYQDPNCVPDTIIYPGYFYVSPGGTNIAEIPNTNLPVAINTLNQNQFSQYFVDNTGGLTVQYDGFTTPLWAKTTVQPGATYHVRIAIADAGDGIFDSGVFLGIESLGGDSLLFVEPDFFATPEPGTKTVGFTDETLWATSWNWNFGDGTTSTERNPTHDYAADGNYLVSLTASNWCSSETFTQQVLIGTSGTTEPAADIFGINPNPTNGAFTLDLKRDASAQVRLQSLDGRLIFDRQLNDGARVDLNAYGKGIFLLQVLSNGNLYTEKVVNR